MKTLSLAAKLTLLLAFTSGSLARAETIVNGVIYPEITELGPPQVTHAATQSSANASSYSVRPTSYVTQLPASPATHGYRDTTIAPADLQPTLMSGQTVQSVPAYNQAAYGYGYTSVGTPQRVVYVQPAAYTNTVPVQQQLQPITYVQPTYVQPVTYVQPANAQPSLTNVQTLAGTAYNPYAQTSPGVPWKPIVNIRNMPGNYVVGQGIIGQPKVYVPNQPVRNFVRYITP